MSLGPAISQPLWLLPVPLQAHPQRIPPHLRDVARPILGGLHDEYDREKKAAARKASGIDIARRWALPDGLAYPQPPQLMSERDHGDDSRRGMASAGWRLIGRQYP